MSTHEFKPLPDVPEENFQDEKAGWVKLPQAKQRYDHERVKRLRQNMNDQFIDISLSDKFSYLQDDPWVDESTIKAVDSMFPQGNCEFMILGGGLGGLIYAARLISKGGLRPDKIRIIDTAGGFGGTWWWNRFPGLKCDIESYCYLPLLEETGFIPKHRYSYGEEIRHYANLIAQKWGFTDSAVFQTKATYLKWDDERKEWEVELQQQRKGQKLQTLTVRSQFVTAANGVLNHPKIPDLQGISDYQGKIFHSARWDYGISGGTPSQPELTKLKDKRVAVVGTGASSVQIIPEVAKWAKHLYVIQRTPAAVDALDQRETNRDWFEQNVATGKGWQRERMRNFHAQFTTGEKPAVNLVDDQWTRAESMVVLSGNPNGPKSVEELPSYIEDVHTLDLHRQNRIRARVLQTVQDKQDAQALQPWYPTWCKRTCPSNEYLTAFNRPNVTLIDTDGKGLDTLTLEGFVAANTTIAVDIIVFATGFRPPFLGCPADKANATIIGRNGIDMSEQWAAEGPSTLHGVLDTNFPNLFLSGPWQAGLSGNNLFNIDNLAQEAAFILREAGKVAGPKKFSVRPTNEAAADWGKRVLDQALPLAAMQGCTPGYFNVEGMLDRLSSEQQKIVAKSGLWGAGVEDYTSIVEKWMEMSGMDDIEVQIMNDE